RVPVVVLDELLAGEPHVDFAKIDVQGAEVAVVRGLERTLSRNRAVGVLCELSPELLRQAGTDAEVLFALLRARGLRPHRVGRDGTDRKSTRLNSSHQIISYAVFCLKKKITNTHSNL